MSAAASPSPIVFEGESMTRVPNDGVAVRVISESAASAGKTQGYRTSPSSGTKQYTTTSAADQITLRMRADSCNGASQATATIDSFAARVIDVPASAYTDYTLALTAANGGGAGAHTLKVDFLNNFKNSTCDRNLYLDKVTIRQVVTAPPPDTVAPAAPTGLTANAADARVDLNWADNSESDFNHYRAYRSTTAGGPYIQANVAPVTASQYADTSLTNATTYHYVVRAVDTAGNVSGDSAEVSDRAARPRQ